MSQNALAIGAFLIIAGFAMVVRARLGLRRHKHARIWPKVRAVVVRSALLEINDGEGSSHTVEITCRYRVQGVEYTTSEHTQGLSIEDPAATRRELEKTYPEGKLVSVSVNPLSPSDAVLQTGYPDDMEPLRRFGCFCALSGAAIVFGALCAPCTFFAS